MSAEFDQLVAEFEAFQAKLKSADDRFANMAEMQEELSELEVSVTSPDRAVTVVAGVGGSIKDIRFTEAAMQLGSQRLSSVVMAAVQDAVAASARRQAGILQEYAGDSPVLDQVLEAQSEATGVPVDELRAQAEQETPPRPPRRVGEEDPATDADTFLKSVFDDEER